MRTRLVTVGWAVLLLAIAANTVGGLENASSIRATQHQLLVSEKASTKTRITTVTQRCELTQLVLDSQVNQGHVTSTVVRRLLASLAGCEKQLAQVIKINAQTPNP